MPISALPSKHGIGALGKEAYCFVDFLKGSKQVYWQILPIGPTGYGDSPYQSFSAYAGNPYWIDLDLLAAEGMLSVADIKGPGFVENPDFVDYGDLYEKRFDLLRKAAVQISPDDKGFSSFCTGNAEWLYEYALFMALKEEHGMRSFHLWPDTYRIYSEKSHAKTMEKLAGKLHFWKAVQYLFFTQWEKFKAYANGSGVKIIGDMPIYVSPDSADLWANHNLFQVNAKREMSSVAGCPPDSFDSDGQLWGNPLYNWGCHKKQGYSWWIKRLKHAGKIFDVVRIDHFRGFLGYYSIPAGSLTAANGKWRRGPGEDFIASIKKMAPEITIIAEDLGYLTPAVHKLLRFSGFPGMKVLQFAFDGSKSNVYLPHLYTENCVVYTGTHDNPTIREWAKSAPPLEIKFAKNYLGASSRPVLEDAMISAAMHCKSNTCIIPVQDWLKLGGEARINTPGVAEGNWRFRVRKRRLSKALAERIRHLTEESGRAMT